MVKSFFLKLVVFGAVLLASYPAFSASQVTATRVWPAEDYTRVTFESKQPLKYQTFTLKNPERLVLDIEDIRLNSVLNALSAQVSSADPYIEKVRIAAYQANVVRVVVDLKQTVNFNVFTLKPAGDYQNRLVLDIIPIKDPLTAMLDKLEQGDEKQATTTVDPLTTGDKQPKDIVKDKPNNKPIKKKRMITIAIDAGHGGEDPGARGAKGSREKVVTLAIAKKLKKQIDAEPNMRGILTRKGDYFVSLKGRVVKARKLKADLFISIHADAFTKQSARGSSVFTLSDGKASSTTARYLAKKENQSDLIGGVSLKNKDPFLRDTLIDLTLHATINDSQKLGKAVLKQVGKINKLHKRHVEKANFAVLRSDIPSILVETAFISNPQEERKLNSSSHQTKLATSILTGIKKYFAANPALARNTFID